ncbi:UNVERIFIED_ORG: hypothetical protein M2438_001576 [Methylobacterium sp. SuP10 SLI 274]|uniref:hypothetical protein n=1 Tax=Methylorubrum extorquens TaxID=408 RepID=UPI00209E0F10|nr:hypothetical protein [Methylorubrum extorquens]MDF9862790.1 hypothetical protein [Methylorubrum pseudosasae]MDH6636401.1 hypothetical protein [Methylobacterium sp. SuP10 SLI 274]MDH6665581.1 hypothetical protein [Methylorubrum zatmanii]MCP1557499.1 hypothetical protein [Methylorubrum extorquens]MDF9791086.1 hypothetical protein [Methylorubrum extorquens]
MSETVHHYYTFLTDAGPLAILPIGAPGWRLLLAKDDLGTYDTLENAFIAAVTGETRIGHGIADWNALGIPGDIDSWQKKVFMKVARLRPA